MKSSKIRDMQLAELEILKEIQAICEKNNLRYYMMGGTFLGSIRHKGFIPWDDDADIALPRNDFEKFIKIFNKECKNNNCLLTSYKNDETYLYYTPRVKNAEVCIINNSKTIKRKVEAWIDIFPLDGMPKSKIMQQIHKYRLLKRRALLKLSDFDSQVSISNKNRNILEKTLIALGKHTTISTILNTKKQLIKLDQLLRKYPFEKSEYVVNFMGAYRFKEMFPRRIYENIDYYQFENLRLPAPKDYDTVLTQMYGDYMKLPPEHERNKHNTEVIKEN